MNFFWLLLFTSFSTVIQCAYIKENGYKEVTISFSESVLKESSFDFLKLKNILTKASDILFHATKRRSYFEDFLIVVPSTWTKGGVCDGFTQKRPSNTDIYVTDSSDISVITTQHSKGCGEKGEIIYVPIEWLADNKRDLALQFVQQWSIFRYGVFSENPERPGSCIISTDFSWSPTGCYNIDLDTPEVEFDENGIPLCSLPDDFERNDLHSSIMFSAANSSKMLSFCDGSDAFPHNPIAPTLHNRICNGNSVWSVIQNTEDFKYGRNLPMRNTKTSKKPKFLCFKESETHLTIMIQDTDSEARSEIRYALFYFLSIIEPVDFAVSLATFSSSSNTNDKDFINIDLQNRKDIKSLLESQVKLNENVEDICLTCGLRKAYKVSETSKYSLRTIVLIARESSLENTKISEMTEIIQKNVDSVLHILFMQDTADDIIPSSLVEAIQNNRGRIFRLKNEPVFMLTELTTALLDASKNILHVEDKIIVVHKKTYVNVTSDITDVFLTPKNAKGKLLYSMQFKKRGDMKFDNCKDMDNDLQSPICGNQIDIDADEDIAKVRNYSFRYVAGSEGTTCSSLALLKLESPSKSSFIVKGWLNENKITPGENALIIYAEIYNRLDNDIKVEARISGPGLQDFRLELRDNGNGDPDIIKGDNIYSRYFTSFSQKGTYTVSIAAEVLATRKDSDNIKENSTDNEMKVRQIKTIGTFRVIQAPPNEDILPPNRVCDLKIVSLNSSSKSISLQWTAPGNDYDYGRANEYKMYFTEDWKNLEEDMIKKAPPRAFNTSEMKPKMNGNQEIEMFQLPKPSSPKIYFIALKAIDKNGNEGKISNIMQAVMDFNNLTQYNDTENNTETITNHHKDDELNYANIYIISGTVLAIIFLIMIVNILIWLFCFQKYKRSHQTAKVTDESNGKQGKNLNSDKNILQDENENSHNKEFVENQKSVYQNADNSNPMLTYARVQKRGRNQEPTNENFKPREVSNQTENDLGFV